MKKLWYLSLAVLLLGNAIDGWATYLVIVIQGCGVECELNPYAKQIWAHLSSTGLSFTTIFVLSKFLFGSIVSTLVWLFPLFARPIKYGSWIGVVLSTFLGFWAGIYMALGGTGISASAASPLVVKVVQRFYYQLEATPSVLWMRTFDAVLWKTISFIGAISFLLGLAVIFCVGIRRQKILLED